MNRVRQLLLTALVYGLWPLVSHAQFAPPDGSSSGDPATNAFGSKGASVFAPSTDQIQNGGLGVRILFVGRQNDSKTLTISAELQNLTKEPIFVALVGPAPAAIDTSGVTYMLQKVGGMAQCETLEKRYIAHCFSNYSGYLPGAAFSLLQPGASAIVATTFAAEQVSASGFLSVSMNIALAKGSRPQDKRDKDAKIENVAISFPLVALTESK